MHSLEKQTGGKIKKLNILKERNDVKIIRSDNFGDYSSKGFAEFCANPYSLEQNGVAERLNRIVVEGARSMLYKANLSLQFWAKACRVVVYLHNSQILPSSSPSDGDEEVQVIPENIMLEIPIEPESAEPVRAQDENAEVLISKMTYENAFMEQVRNLGPVRQHRAPNKYADEDCLVVDSLPPDIDEPKSVEKA